MFKNDYIRLYTFVIRVVKVIYIIFVLQLKTIQKSNFVGTRLKSEI